MEGFLQVIRSRPSAAMGRSAQYMIFECGVLSESESSGLKLIGNEEGKVALLVGYA